MVDENVRGRLAEARKAEDIVAEELDRYEGWYQTLEVVPTIVSLRDKMDGIVRGEMERVSSWLEGLSDADRERVQILASSIVNKILHDPITGLKEESQENGAARTRRPCAACSAWTARSRGERPVEWRYSGNERAENRDPG